MLFNRKSGIITPRLYIIYAVNTFQRFAVLSYKDVIN